MIWLSHLRYVHVEVRRDDLRRKLLAKSKKKKFPRKIFTPQVNRSNRVCLQMAAHKTAKVWYNTWQTDELLCKVIGLGR